MLHSPRRADVARVACAFIACTYMSLPNDELTNGGDVLKHQAAVGTDQLHERRRQSKVRAGIDLVAQRQNGSDPILYLFSCISKFNQITQSQESAPGKRSRSQ